MALHQISTAKLIFEFDSLAQLETHAVRSLRGAVLEELLERNMKAVNDWAALCDPTAPITPFFTRPQ